MVIIRKIVYLFLGYSNFSIMFFFFLIWLLDDVYSERVYVFVGMERKIDWLYVVDL